MGHEHRFPSRRGHGSRLNTRPSSTLCRCEAWNSGLETRSRRTSRSTCRGGGRAACSRPRTPCSRSRPPPPRRAGGRADRRAGATASPASGTRAGSRSRRAFPRPAPARGPGLARSAPSPACLSSRRLSRDRPSHRLAATEARRWSGEVDRHRYSLSDYLALEEASNTTHEFLAGRRPGPTGTRARPGCGDPGTARALARRRDLPRAPTIAVPV